MRICLDPGHGGKDNGAVGPTGIMEKSVSLRICLSLRELLESKGHDVYLTRAVDKYVKLSERSKIGNFCDFMVSVHCNAYFDKSVEGVETIYSLHNERSRDLAGFIQNALVDDVYSGVKHKDRGLKISPSVQYSRTLYILDNVKKPAALAELEFISNPKWESILDKGTTAYASILYGAISKFIRVMQT